MDYDGSNNEVYILDKKKKKSKVESSDFEINDISDTDEEI